MTQKVIDKKLVDLERLAEWMDQQEMPKGEIENVRLLVGGTQNILLRFSRGGKDCVLRRGPRHLRPQSNGIMVREATILAALKGTDVPHPEFYAVCEDEDVIGVVFFIMEHVDGFNPSMGLPKSHSQNPEYCRRMGFSVTDGLLALGALDYLELGLEGFGKPENYLERQVSRWGSQLEGYSKFEDWTGISALPNVEIITSWLDKNCPKSFEPGIIHGDCHLANVRFHSDSPELAALVDWELATIGDPLLDLGWQMATWPNLEGTSGFGNSHYWKGMPSIDELVAHYVERTDRDASNISWYAVLACFKLGVILEGTHARASAGKAPKPVGDMLHATTIGLFNNAMQWVAAE